MKLKDLFVESFKIEEKPLVDFSGILGKLVGAEFSWLVKNHSNKIEYVNKTFSDLFLKGHKENEYAESLYKLMNTQHELNQWQHGSIGNLEFIYTVMTADIISQKSDYYYYVFIAIQDFMDTIPEFPKYAQLNDYFNAVLESIDDGIFITDGDGNVTIANKVALAGKNSNDIIGRNMRDLVNEGCYPSSIALKVIEEGKTLTVIQHEEKRELLTTAVPYFKNGKINMVVCCERAIDELYSLKKQLVESQEINSQYERELQYLRSLNTKSDGLIAESIEMRKVVELAKTASMFDSRILIEGETGVGKEVIAKFIYQNSQRKGKPFIVVNCGAIPENLFESELFGYEKGAFTGANKQGKKGFFELADKGVIFLDEIGELSYNLQVKLLRAIQEEEITPVGGSKKIQLDVQIIAATNKNLRKMVEKGEFRSDLYYRLSVFPIKIPPLRQRKKDIIPLICWVTMDFNKKYNLKKEFSSRALNLLENYEWPGNVRELENVVERLMMTSEEDIIDNVNVLPLIYSSEFLQNDNEESCSLEESINNFERDFLLLYIKKYRKVSELEKVLKVSRSTLNRRITKYGLRQYLTE